MNNNHLEVIIGLIREAVNEDWIEDFEIDADTNFNDDLELESIELVVIAEKIQSHYGAAIDFNNWLGSLELDQMMALTVGQLADFVKAQTSKG